MSESVTEQDRETPVLVTSSSGLAVAHGPGVTISHHGSTYPFLADGATFVKYHQQPTFLNHSGRRLMFYQHNALFWLKPGVGRPRPGEEQQVDPQYQAPLTSILAVHAGKHGKCFTQSKQAMAVPEERAWSLLVRRRDGKEEHVDFEASSREERDKWATAVQQLVATAKKTEMERDSKLQLVNVAYLVDQQGNVKLTIHPTASLPERSAAAALAPLTVSTAATHRRTKTEDDTPSPQPAANAAASAQHSSSAQPTTALHAPASALSAAGVVITDAANSATAQRTAATSTSGLDAAGSDEKLKAALAENERLKERIAELEEQLKGSHVDTVPAS